MQDTEDLSPSKKKICPALDMASRISPALVHFVYLHLSTWTFRANISWKYLSWLSFLRKLSFLEINMLSVLLLGFGINCGIHNFTISAFSLSEYMTMLVLVNKVVTVWCSHIWGHMIVPISAKLDF